LLSAVKTDPDQTLSLAFSDDNRFLVGGTRDSGVYLWSLASGRVVRSFDHKSLAYHVNVSTVAMSRDGKLIAAGLSERAVSTGDIGPEHGIKVWDVASGTLKLSLQGHDSGVSAVAFSAGDRWIVSSGYDGTVRYWDPVTGKMVALFSTAPDGRWLVVTDRGFFAGSPNGEDLVTVVHGLSTYSVSRFYEALYQPAVVRELLRGDPKEIYSKAARDLDLRKILDSIPAPHP
jgi:WD40 repeat protein